ncbi:M24 family metallopeptidase [Zongyangia hominis]|uniref:Aminopeptidase P family protein n=1 Tax=Zongyangia hominis TaxID=2763677 RepID=A0A926EBG6_9FIRM|nr:Xaa-Pro peptidase family protein [Zongyangia hominis]MBC8570718.1 aminopeptidase P family protein [Zongyangia hominis]
MNTQRLARLCAKMEGKGLDQLILSHPTHIKYLTGLSLSGGERLLTLNIRRSGEARFVANRLFPLSEDCGVEIVWYSDWDDCVGVLASTLSDGETVGLDHNFASGFALALAGKKPQVRLVPGSGAIDEVRMIKEPEEIALMRLSSRANDQCMDGLIRSIRGDLSERELADHLYDLSRQAGTDGYAGGAIISYGENAVDAHHAADATALHPGDNIVMDFGFGYHGYRSDMTRTVFYRQVSPELGKIYEIVLEAQLAAVDAVRPGVRFSEIDRAAREIIERAGYGEYLPHRVGHGIGLDVHEPPYVVGGNAMKLLPGMIFSIEPGIYKPGVGGVRIEDLMLVTPEGSENLNHYTKQMQIIP